MFCLPGSQVSRGPVRPSKRWGAHSTTDRSPWHTQTNIAPCVTLFPNPEVFFILAVGFAFQTSPVAIHVCSLLSNMCHHLARLLGGTADDMSYPLGSFAFHPQRPPLPPPPPACGLEPAPEKGFPPAQDEPPPYPGSPPYPALSPPVSPPLPPSVPHYAEADIVSLQGVSGNNMYAVPALASSSPGADAGPLPELQRQCLVFKEKLGEGQFGEVIPIFG